MKILVYFNFIDEQITQMQHLARSCGDHELVHAATVEEAIRLAPGSEAILGIFPPEVCAAAPELRWAQSHSAGMNTFLFPDLIDRDVTITNMAGIYAPQGGEHAWALLLALARGLHRSLPNQAERKWGNTGPIIELTGGTLSLIGMGGFGVETAIRAQGYDMEILALDPRRSEKPDYLAELKPPTKENLHDLLRRSDAVVIACPLIPETYHLISHDELAQMKNTAYLINVTRGGIIDEPALIEALHNGQIAGAGLDVCEGEPLTADDPLWDAPNLIITPHTAGASQHRPRKVFEFFCTNLERYLKGEDLVNIVDKKSGF